MRFFVLCILSLILQKTVFSQLRLPSVISSRMVLQQNDSVTLWGWSAPASRVYITTGWNNHKDSTQTDNESKWRIKVKTPAAGGPFTISIKSDKTIVLDDVLIGEVWVCSGQSNMQWSYNNGEKDVAEELASIRNNNIRLFNIPTTAADYPQDDLKAAWEYCDSNTVKNFSSVGYFFGKRLNQDLNIPVGLINSSWGGTTAEVWTPENIIENKPALKEAASKIQCYNWWPCKPGRTYNAMIAPVSSFNIAGVIWYQGEGNVAGWNTYTELFTTMIEAWRKSWKKNLPFYYVQIAPYRYGKGNRGALLQEAQTKAMNHPNTGMVVVSDLTDSVTNIHPSHKREVGYRLAGWALAETYGKQGIIYKSPSFTTAVIDKDKILLSLRDAPNGLVIKGKKPEGFFVAGSDGNWLPAEIKIDKDRVWVWNKSLQNPVYVRYGFGDTRIGNLSGKDGLPVIHYRNDHFDE